MFGNILTIKAGNNTLATYEYGDFNGKLLKLTYGNGEGYGSGMSYSVGLVDNYDSPEDYSGPFIDINAGYDIGVDHCWDPRKPHGSATQATALSFSSGLNYGLGVDVYSRPVQLFEW